MTQDQAIQVALTELLRVFPPTPIDANAFARANGVWDGYHRCDEFDRDVQRRTWEQLSSSFVDSHGGALFFLAPVAFVAVIPAYLAALLRAEIESETSGYTFSQLVRARRPEKFDARLELLSREQRAAIKHVLETLHAGTDWVMYRDEIETAIADFSTV